MAQRPTALYITGRAIKGLFYSLIALLCGFLVWRIYFSTATPGSMKALLPNSALSAAYEEYGDDLEMFRQTQSKITRSEENYNYFTVVDCVIIPEAGQVQVLVRYNKGIVKHVFEDFGLDAVPDSPNELFDLTLVRTTDLTPDDPTDNQDREKLGAERYSPSSASDESTLLYIYRRVVFDDVDISDAVALFFDVYYLGDVDYDEYAYGTLCLYDAEAKNNPASLTSADKKALIQ